MNEQLRKLMNIADKKEKLVLGLMSGTSLDGLDIALCNITGAGTETTIDLLEFTSVSYGDAFRHTLMKVCFNAEARLDEICLINKEIAITHSDIILKTLHHWNVDAGSIDLIASHGQTVFHQPNTAIGHTTLQLGDGDFIANKTGIITVSDFRQKHISAGGEGAPLAAYGDYLLFQNKSEDRFLINIGGISNITFIPSNAIFEQVICTDIGPGNKLMDLWIQQHYEGMSQDTDALIASKGKVNFKLLNQLQSDLFFELPFPKSTGPELFSMKYLTSSMHCCDADAMRHEDVLATLNLFTANCIFDAVEQLMRNPEQTKIFISGGGSKNPLLMSHLENHFDYLKINITDELSIPADAKEAMLFALLANECVAGNKEVFDNGAKTHPAVSMGKISLPY
jgi:anhydro-N-acetylmuramic acid kinase